MRTLLAAAISLIPSVAVACSGAACVLRLAPSNATLPANAPGVVLFSPYHVSSVEKNPSNAGVTVARSDGGIVNALFESAPHGGLLIRPVTGFEAGESYVVRYPACAGGTPTEAAFATSAAQPMPTALGTFTVKEAGHGEVSLPGGSACVETLPGAYARFAVDPSPALRPFLAITAWRLLVDGQPWAVEKPGALDDHGSLEGVSPPTRRALEVSTACVNSTIALGLHHAELQAFVAGVPDPLTATVDFSLDCSSPRGCSAVPGPFWFLAALALRRRSGAT